MPLFKPNSAVFKTGWKEVKRSDYCVLEKRSDTMFRIATISPPRIIATSNVSEEDMMIDWDYIHDSVLPTFDESDQTTGQLIDFVATTVERMEEEAAALQEQELEFDDDDEEEEVVEPEAEPEEEESTFLPVLPAGLTPAARPSARRAAAPAEAAPAPAEPEPEPEPEAEPEPVEEERPELPPGLMPAARPSSRRKETSFSAIEPVVPQQKPAAAPAPAPAPAAAPKPAPAPAPTNKLDKGAVEQMKLLETKRSKIVKGLEPAFAKYRAAMEAAHKELATEMQRLASVNGFDRETCERMIRAENGGFLSVLNTQLMHDNAPGLKCLDEQIEESNKGYKMRQSVLTIQRAYRSYMFRKTVAAMSKASFRREKAAREIVESEEAYVNNLKLIMDYYYTPLKHFMNDGKMITQQQFKDLFLNLDKIYEFNRKVLEAFKNRMKDYDNRTTCIGDIFKQFKDMSQLYQLFVSTFDRSNLVLNKLLENADFAKWQEEVAMKPELHRMRISTLLIMPVQRVPRYMLLIRELISKTPESHPDYALLKDALDFVSKVGSEINEAKRHVESQEKVRELQEHLKGQLTGIARDYSCLVYEGPCARDTGSGVQLCYIYLLTDQLIVTKGKAKYKVSGRIILLNAQVSEIPENRDSKWRFGFQITTPNKNSVIFYFDFDNECTKWLNYLEQTIKELPMILTKFPQDRERLQMLANKGKQASTSSSDGPMNAHVKEIITICDEIVTIQGELMKMPVDLRTMFPTFYAQLHPDHIQHLRSRIEVLGAKLTTLDKLNARATQLIGTDETFLQVDKLVSEAMPYLEAMKTIITKSFPKVPGAPRLPKSRDPQLLMRYILFWYVKLCEAWQAVTDLPL